MSVQHLTTSSLTLKSRLTRLALFSVLIFRNNFDSCVNNNSKLIIYQEIAEDRKAGLWTIRP